MAVTRKGSFIRMTAANDEVAEKLLIHSIILDHTAAASATIRTDGADMLSVRSTTSVLTVELWFSKPVWFNGIRAQALSAGTLTFVLA